MASGDVAALQRTLAAPFWEPYRAAILASARPSWSVQVERIARVRTSWLDRLIGRRAAEPSLPPDASKLGGVPYLEHEDDWPRDEGGERLPFIAQINFAELPRIDAPAPTRGIFVLFAQDLLPGARWLERSSYLCRWYPEPAGPTSFRASSASKLRLQGPCHTRWEYRVRATPTLTVSHASWWNTADWEAGEPEIDALMEWDERVAGTVGAFTVATLDCSSPRNWFGPSPPADGSSWLQIWDQRFEETWGSLTQSVVVHADDLAEGRLDRYRVVLWQ